MKFYLIDTKENKEITVKRWNGSHYHPDCFGDLEINFPEEHEQDENGNILCTSDDYEVLKELWENEIAAMNNGTMGEIGDYSEQPDEDICIFAD